MNNIEFFKKFRKQFTSIFLREKRIKIKLKIRERCCRWRCIHHIQHLLWWRWQWISKLIAAVARFETIYASTNCRRLFFYCIENINKRKTTSYKIAPQCLPTWDKQMQTLCTQVNCIIEKIQVAQPDWSRVTLAAQLNN